MKNIYISTGSIILLTISAITFMACSDQTKTAAEIVENCIQAMGGKEKIEAFETIRLIRSKPSPYISEIKRPNLIRKEGRSILVFDGKRAAFLKPPPAEDGTIPPPQIIPAEELKDFEIDIALRISAFLDHPSEYLGLENNEGAEFHRLSVTLPMGTIMIYTIDAGTWLVKKLAFDITREGTVYHNELTYSDYRMVDGILYPFAYSFMGRDPITLDRVEINVALDDAHFAIPEGIE